MGYDIEKLKSTPLIDAAVRIEIDNRNIHVKDVPRLRDAFLN
jgi:hypothetical protein